ncbi:RNA-directed DNA polymerase, eukaryota, partial [Tanacetum coccineum]
MEQVNLFCIKSCWGNFAFDFIVSPSVGNSGGVLCVWDSNMFRKGHATVSDYFIAIMGKWVPNDKNLLIISVYAPQELSEKKMLWQYLNHMIDRWKGEVIVMGDFNEVRSPDERFGSIFNSHGAAAFNNFISLGGLMEVPTGGYSYTWSHKSASKMSKLDGFLISEDFFNSCPKISAIILDRYLSDHRPILLREANFDYGPTPFRFYHHWFEIDGFDSFVADTWRVPLFSNLNPMLRLVTKLKHLKVGIRKWIKEKNVKSVIIKKGLKTKLADIDHSLDKGEAPFDSLEERMSIMSKLADLEKIDSIELAQKAMIKWSIKGDENSKYFHGIINKQRNNIAIRGILVDGAWIGDPVIVKNEFFNHFKYRFNITSSDRLTLDMEFPNKLSFDQKTDLERPFTKEEIKGAVWDCRLNESSGPDGFTFGFYQRYWCLLEPDIVDVVNHFFTHFFPRKGCNSSFIALIPKSHDAKQVKDFRPISLIRSLYKIIAKLLANRLVLVMGNLVNEVQSAFIDNRQILDDPFILNEILQWCKAKKKQTILFKVDFEKAFDSVRWDFLDDVLKKFDFGDRWYDWIQSCLRSSRGSILVNGSPTSEFQFHKGLKQGLQINLHKSKIMGIAVDSSIVDLAAADIGCMTLKSLFSYLGVKIGGRVDLKDRKISLVKWENVLASKEKGGLGVSSFYALNRALIFKWIWRFHTQNSSLWARVIKAIHGMDGKVSCTPSASFSSNWIDIVREAYTVRNQDNVPLKYLFPRIYALESIKSITVAKKVTQPGLVSSLRRMPKGGIEQHQMAELCLNMEDTILPNMMD